MKIETIVAAAIAELEAKTAVRIGDNLEISLQEGEWWWTSDLGDGEGFIHGPIYREDDGSIHLLPWKVRNDRGWRSSATIYEPSAKSLAHAILPIQNDQTA